MRAGTEDKALLRLPNLHQRPASFFLRQEEVDHVLRVNAVVPVVLPGANEEGECRRLRGFAISLLVHLVELPAQRECEGVVLAEDLIEDEVDLVAAVVAALNRRAELYVGLAVDGY